MQLCHTHRQLLSRCTLRWYSVGTSSDVIASSDVQVPPRLKRPLASTFGGINIQNVVVPTQSVSHHFGNKTKKPSRSNDSNDQSPHVRRMSQTERKKGMGRGGASSWGDGLVSLSFASRLKLRQDKPTTRGSDTEPHPQEAQSRKQNSYQAQHPQMHGHRRGQKQQQQEHDDASPTHRHSRTETRKSATAAAVQQGNRTSAPSTDAKNDKPKASSMTRPSSSPTFNRDPRSTTAAAAAAKITKADTASLLSSSNTSATQQPTTASDRKARLATLSSTNLNALFRTTTNTPTAGISIPSTASDSGSARARVRSVLERSAGDYSRFLPRDVGMRKDSSRLPGLRAARHALATQRDLSLEQRRVALHIIGGLVQPRREVRAL